MSHIITVFNQINAALNALTLPKPTPHSACYINDNGCLPCA